MVISTKSAGGYCFPRWCGNVMSSLSVLILVTVVLLVKQLKCCKGLSEFTIFLSQLTSLLILNIVLG